MRRFFKVKNFFLISFLAVAGIFSVSAVSYKYIQENNEMEETKAATASEDTPLLIACYDNATNAFDNTTIAVEYYWDGYSRSIKTDVIGNQIRSVTLPKGTKGFNIYRMKNDKAGYLPYDGAPGSNDYYNRYNYGFVTDWNMVIFTDSSLNRTTATCDRPILKKGSTITFNTTAFGDWFANNASPSIYTYCNNYYGTWAWWNNMVRIGGTQYMTFTADINYVVDGFIITRDNPSGDRGTGKHNWSDNKAIWNRTTDITYMQSGGLVSILNTKTGDNYNWKNPTTDEDYAEMWGNIFLDCVTCDGAGSVTGGSAWGGTPKDFYNSLNSTRQYIIFTATGEISGTTALSRAIYKYDYILHKYGKSSYEDYINRIDGKGSGSKYPYSLNRSFSPIDLISDNENNLSTIIVIIASSVSLLSVTALSVLLVKKRKAKQD